MDREPAFSAYVAARRAKLFRTACLLCGDQHRAEDIVQDTLARLYANWPRVSRADNVEGYVRRLLVKSDYSDRRRPWRRESTSTTPMDLPLEPGMAPDGADAIWTAIRSLPPGQRKVVVLRHIWGCSVEETAADLGISIGAVKSQIDDNVITRLVELHDHIKVPATPPGADVSRGERMLRRRRTVVTGAVAAAVVAMLGIAAVTTFGQRAGDRIEPIQPGATATSTDDKWLLERIRAEGRVEDGQVTKSGITLRTYVLCDGSPECSPHTDEPIRRGHEHFAIEVTQDARSALFRIGNSAMTVVTAYDDDTLLVMDPLQTEDVFGPDQNSYRLVRANGTKIRLQVDSDPAPAVPGPGVVLINHYDIDPDDDSMASQIVLVVDENEGTVRVLDMPKDIDARRTWGPNPDEFLWFVTFSCDVHFWTPNGTFESREGGCTGSFDPGHYQTDESGNQTDDFGNPGSGDITWVNGDWFPDAWLEPGRMAFLERNFLGRNDVRLPLHVTLDQGATWQRIPVSDEAAIPDTLRHLG